ncbi:cyclic nucleotide-binding domain-containing protein [Angustibacter sp. McL0619]|uniref:cyclic nucleotide-binding domain-containing protein n=1 Tax=Angustibacter sp. McL0619 TaxID=3415676 RepID=UPI003CF55CF1
MRVEATATTVSWIPSESVSGPLRRSFDIGLSHYDPPPPELLSGAAAVHELRRADRLRFANVLSVWADLEDGAVLGAGVDPAAGLVMGSTTMRMAGIGATFRAVRLPVLRAEPELVEDGVRFVQTVGGRTAAPLPRPVPHPPFVRWTAPLVWTTLAITVHRDGSHVIELAGASAFPRHWLYGDDGRLAGKSGLTDMNEWAKHSFGTRTPWGEQDSRALVAAAESDLERQMSGEIMRAGQRPRVRRLRAGEVLTRQGELGDELYLLLDGVLSVDVDGRAVAEVGPGAVLGERALLEQGRRTSTLTAVTPVRVAVAPGEAVDVQRLTDLARSHRREESVPDPGH